MPSVAVMLTIVDVGKSSGGRRGNREPDVDAGLRGDAAPDGMGWGPTPVPPPGPPPQWRRPQAGQPYRERSAPGPYGAGPAAPGPAGRGPAGPGRYRGPQRADEYPSAAAGGPAADRQYAPGQRRPQEAWHEVPDYPRHHGSRPPGQASDETVLTPSSIYAPGTLITPPEDGDEPAETHDGYGARHEPGFGPFAQGQPQRIEQDRLPRPGLAGQHAQSRTKRRSSRSIKTISRMVSPSSIPPII